MISILRRFWIPLALCACVHAQDPGGHIAAGAALDLKGQYEEARRHFAQAIEGAPPEGKARALKAMAMSYAFERNCAGAAKYEQQVFDVQNEAKNFTAAAETADELARICLESGSPDVAQTWYGKGHETALRKPDLTPAETDLWAFRWEHAQARIAARKGQAAEAHRHVEAAKQILERNLNPDQARFFPYLTGYVAFYLGDAPTAVAELKGADQRDPFILTLLGQAYDKSGDRAQALEFYRKALASNAHNPTNAYARPFARDQMEGKSGAVPAVSTFSAPVQRVVVVRMKNQTDMLAGLQEAVAREKIKNAVIMGGFGSVTAYHVHVVGNTTLPPQDVFSKDAGPYDLLGVSGLVMAGRVHCHLTLASTQKALGGHLEAGTKVFTFAVISLGILGDDVDMTRADDWTWH